ncbi:RNA polymerase sigma factor [Actinoallomurus sp. CA-150999]|uniref:RNA polymerase sigma factor n=1 Tax=Actinoallomurus sp. CA-150999 TaxID=3239887 RepID=UPI003D8BA1EA
MPTEHRPRPSEEDEPPLDKDEFAAVYGQNYRPLLGYALWRCHSPDDAADVVAETFAIAWRRADDLPPGDETRLWLYGAARRVLANHRRGERRHAIKTAMLRDELAVLPTASSDTPGLRYPAPRRGRQPGEPAPDRTYRRRRAGPAAQAEDDGRLSHRGVQEGRLRKLL